MLTLDGLIKKLTKKVERDGLDQTAKDLDMHPSTLHHYVKGIRKPAAENFLKLMERLG